MRVLGWLVGIPIALVVVVFAVANRQPATLDLWPLPWSVQVPTYLAVLGALGVGILVGVLAATVTVLKARRRAGRERRRAESLSRQLQSTLPPEGPPSGA